MSALRLAVLASGGGSNLQALLDRFNAVGGAAARVELVIGSAAGIGALSRAREAGVAIAVHAEKAPGAPESLLDLLRSHQIDLVVLAGYLRRVPDRIVQAYGGRMINIHPALLPSFGGEGMYGIRVHRAVLASGATVSGATVHFVDEAYDAGRILAQWPVPVLPDDSAETLAARVLRVEHLLLPAVVEQLASRGAADRSAPDAESFGLIGASVPPAEQVAAVAAAAVARSHARSPS